MSQGKEAQKMDELKIVIVSGDLESDFESLKIDEERINVLTKIIKPEKERNLRQSQIIISLKPL